MPPNKNASLLRTLLVKADTLSCMVSDKKFPVLLRPLAERRKVTAVEFCPLLVDAMITTHPSGFRILFNSDGGAPSDLREQYERESSENLMPARLRFSLAHEIAHTLFFDLSEGPPQIARTFRAGGTKTALENLERNCNKLAAHLLLPTPILQSEFTSMKAVNPEALLNLAHRAGVSVEVLVRRISEAGFLFVERYFVGCIVLARQDGNEVTITAMAKPLHLNIASELRLMRAGERWQLRDRQGISVFPAGLFPESQIKLTVESAQTSSERDYRVTVEKAGGFGSSISYLLTFEEVKRN